MKGGNMMSLFMLLYDDNSNSFLVVATLPKIRCSVKWQSMHKTVCVCVCLKNALLSYLQIIEIKM